MKRYLPLLVLVLVAGCGSFALTLNQAENITWMPLFMGLLFCQFSTLKLFNLSQFAQAFQMYDLIAKRSRAYAHLYPFIELGLGLSYLAGAYPVAVNSITAALTAIGTLGVLQALRAKLDLRCACMGTTLNVPLSTVTLAEDLGMGAMALAMLWSHT